MSAALPSLSEKRAVLQPTAATQARGKLLRLLVACPWGPATSPKTISGVACYLIPQLRRHFDVLVADPETNPFTDTPLEQLRRLGSRTLRHWLKPPPPVFPSAHRNTTRKFSRWLNLQLATYQPDVVLTFGYAPMTYLRRTLPAFLYVDYAFQFKALDGIFDWIKAAEISTAEIRTLQRCDRAGLHNCRRVFTTSPRIAAGIARYYPEFASKLVSAGIGANLEGLPTAYTPRPLEPLNLIFISTNFERKGGRLALALFDVLKAQYPQVRLHLVGDRPADLPADPQLIVHGWLDKSEPTQRERLCQILRQSHLHILPTRGDLTPHSICEMNAFSIPTISRDVGGVADLLEDGVSGKLVNAAADGVEALCAWRAAVTEVLASYEMYSIAAFEKYHREQTWEVVAERMAQQIVASL